MSKFWKWDYSLGMWPSSGAKISMLVQKMTALWGSKNVRWPKYVKVNHISNFEVFSANFCRCKLWIYQHFDFLFSYKVRYLVEVMFFSVRQNLRVFLKIKLQLTRNQLRRNIITNYLFLYWKHASNAYEIIQYNIFKSYFWL